MRKDSIYRKKWSVCFFVSAIIALFFMALCVDGVSFQNIDTSYVTCNVNGEYLGIFHDKQEVQEIMKEARLEVGAETGQLPVADIEIQCTEKQNLLAILTDASEAKSRLKTLIHDADENQLHQAYIVKINEYTVTLGSREDVIALLEKAVSKYDTSGDFTVELEDDSEDGHNYHARIVSVSRSVRDASLVTLNSGIGSVTDELQYGDRNVVNEEEGTVLVEFEEQVEVLEGYAPSEQIVSLKEAIAEVTKEKETNQMYEIQAGDSLSVIAYEHDTTMESIIALNDDIKDENSVIIAGQEIIISVPEPELSVVTTVQEAYNEEYKADTVYIDNDSWYTNQTEVKQEATVGNRDVVAQVTYRNGKEISRNIIKETVNKESKPAIIERGTIVPPTYIKPLYGGIFTSGFKFRWGRWHKGIDYACPVGTSIMASSSGTVSAAGWSNGYGYCVRIRHPDGRETRYGHLSKVLVHAGQQVKQGEKIALSGNTGRSTGPHVHFEILINGVQVDPLKYMN